MPAEFSSVRSRGNGPNAERETLSEQDLKGGEEKDCAAAVGVQDEGTQTNPMMEPAPKPALAKWQWRSLLSRKARVVLVLIVVAVGVLLIARTRVSPGEGITYQNQSLAQWFYAGRTNFHLEKTSNEADVAFQAVGTNALPFLLANLEARGDSALYFRLYGSAPRRIQSVLHYPISAEDIQMRVFRHLTTYKKLPEASLEALVKKVPELKHPLVRISGLTTVYRLTEHRTPEPFILLSERLLADGNFGVRLQAALGLVEKDAKGKHANAAPVLLSALEHEAELDYYLNHKAFYFREPPGSPGAAPRYPSEQIRRLNSKEMQQKRILRAVGELAPLLSEGQRAIVSRYESNNVARGPSLADDE
jgi:hypothetical protein